jgi:hypothetical protein
MAPVQFPQTFGRSVNLGSQTNMVNDVGHKYVKIYANTNVALAGLIALVERLFVLQL